MDQRVGRAVGLQRYFENTPPHPVLQPGDHAQSVRLQENKRMQVTEVGAVDDQDFATPSILPPSFHDEAPLLTGKRHPRRLDAMSPLRYPGSKRKMLPSIEQLIGVNIPRPELFVEPFCGGASVALGLLEVDAVERVLLADLNPLIAAFWQEATTNADRLIDDMMQEAVTVERWDHWRAADLGRPETELLSASS